MSQTITRIAHVAAATSISSGGVGPAISGFVNELNKIDSMEITVFSGQYDDSEPASSPWENTRLITYPVTGPEGFGFSRGMKGSIMTYNPSLVHSHGIWMYNSVAASATARSLSCPYVVSVHGMLDQWAIENSRLRKMIAYYAYERRNLKLADCFVALCDSELEAIRSFGISAPVAVIPNGVSPPQGSRRLSAESGKDGRTLLYLGRIDKKKRVKELVEAWLSPRIQKESSAKNWNLVVVGWGEDSYVMQIKELVAASGSDSRVELHGPMFNNEKERMLSASNAFILPSSSEGIPISALEAWAAGLPIMITNQCNLGIGFEAEAAILTSPNREGIVDSLVELFEKGDEELNRMGKKGQEVVRNHFNWKSISQDYHCLYEWLLGRASKPSFVYG